MTKLIPLDVAARKYRQNQKESEDRNLLQQKLNGKQFGSSIEPSDISSAYKDKHIASAYAQIRNNFHHVKDSVRHATCSSPYLDTPVKTKKRVRPSPQLVKTPVETKTATTTLSASVCSHERDRISR